MSDQTKIVTISDGGVATAGPADPNASMRAKVWASFAVLTPLLAALATFGILSDEQANALNGAVTAAVGLLSAFGFGFVAKKTNEQVKNGTFDPAPTLPAYTALEQMAILRDQAAAEVDRAVSTVQAGAEAMTSATQVAASVLGAVPIPGAQQAVGAVQDLLDDIRGQ